MRWDPSGTLLASAGIDKRVKLVDFKAGKVIHTDSSTDESKFFITFSVFIENQLFRVTGSKNRVFRLNSNYFIPPRRGQKENYLIY